MRKVGYVLVFLLSIGASVLLFPYLLPDRFPNIAESSANTLTTHIDIPGGADELVYERADGSEIIFRVLRGVACLDVIAVEHNPNLAATTLQNVFYTDGIRAIAQLPLGENFILAGNLDFAALASQYGGRVLLDFGTLGSGVIFHGNNYRIRNAQIGHVRVSEQGAVLHTRKGLFATNNGTIQNVIIDATNRVTGTTIVNVNNGTVYDVANYAAVFSGFTVGNTPRRLNLIPSDIPAVAHHAAGLVLTNNGTINKSLNFGNVDGGGGIALTNNRNATILNSRNEGNIRGSGMGRGIDGRGSVVGGIVSINRGLIDDVQNIGDIIAPLSAIRAGEPVMVNGDWVMRATSDPVRAIFIAGGIAGLSEGVAVTQNGATVRDPNAGTIKNAINAGIVTAIDTAGGIVGVFAGHSRVYNCENLDVVRATGDARQRASFDGVAGGLVGAVVAPGTLGNSIEHSTNRGVVVARGSARGIIGRGNVNEVSTSNFGRLNGRTEFTLMIDTFLAEQGGAYIIIGVVAVLVMITVVSMIIERRKTIRNRRVEVETILHNM